MLATSSPNRVCKPHRRLIWQVAELIYQHQTRQTAAADGVAAMLRGCSASDMSAARVGAELTSALPTG
jgi:hypothetical protein